jgi:hypothetical protein
MSHESKVPGNHIRNMNFNKKFEGKSLRQHGGVKMAIHCIKRLAAFPSPAWMSLTKLSLAGNNLIIPR